MYLLIRALKFDKISSFVAALWFNLNLYFLTLRNGHFTLVNAFGLGPLVLYMCIKALEKKSKRISVAAGIIGSFAATYEVRAFFIICIVIGLYILFRKQVIQDLKTIIYFGLVVIGINSYWLAGLWLSSGSMGIEILNRAIMSYSGVNIVSAMLMRLSWNDPIPLYSWILPILAITGFFLNKKNKHVQFFSALFILGVFLNKLSGYPFSTVYPWLFYHLPGFNAFRESSKFLFLSNMGFAVLIASLLHWAKQKNALVFCGLFILSSVCIFLPTITIINGQFGMMLTRRHVPEAYLKLNKFIESDSEFGRVLSVPWESRWTTFSLNHPRLSLGDLANGPWLNQYNYKEYGLNFREFDQEKAVLVSPHAEDLLGDNSIKYLIIPQVDKENEDYFLAKFENKEEYEKLLSSLNYLEKVNIDTGQISVFKVKSFKPKIHTTASIKQPKIEKLSGSSYKVTNIDTEESVLKINLAEQYHPGWQAVNGTERIPSTITSSTINSFTIKNPKKEIFIEFAPQKVFDYFLIIPLSTLIISLYILIKKNA